MAVAVAEEVGVRVESRTAAAEVAMAVVEVEWCMAAEAVVAAVRRKVARHTEVSAAAVAMAAVASGMAEEASACR